MELDQTLSSMRGGPRHTQEDNKIKCGYNKFGQNEFTMTWFTVGYSETSQGWAIN